MVVNMEQKTEAKITKDMIIGEVLELYPQTMPVFEYLGVHCVGCHGQAFESVEMGLKGHGMTDEEFEVALKKLNNAVVSHNDNLKTESELKDVNVTITDNAVKKIKEFLEKEKKEALRISVEAGGCSGFKYGMELVEKQLETDLKIEKNGVKVFIDKKSLEMFNGATVDYVDSLGESGFRIDNPSATSNCGCGKSFS
jgi:iron-sulfur cluster assembly accessory protein